MKVTTYARWKVNDDGSFTLLDRRAHDYLGPVAQAKKGRKKAKRASERAEAREIEQDRIRAEAEAIQRANREKAEELISPYESLGLDELSPYASSQLGADTENISRVYRGMREAADRAVNARGFGRAPSGFAASQRNTLARGQAEQETDAFRRAQGLSEEGRRLALGYRTGQQRAYDPTERNIAAGSLGMQSGEQAERLGRMGSTFGDVMSGIGAVGQLATDFIIPGARGLTGFLKKKPNMSMGSAGNRYANYQDW